MVQNALPRDGATYPADPLSMLFVHQASTFMRSGRPSRKVGGRSNLLR